LHELIAFDLSSNSLVPLQLANTAEADIVQSPRVKQNLSWKTQKKNIAENTASKDRRFVCSDASSCLIQPRTSRHQRFQVTCSGTTNSTGFQKAFCFKKSLIYPVRKAKQSRYFFQRADVMEHFGSWTAPAWTNPESWKHLWTFAPFQQDFL
jgi:hypothetical protein